MASPDTGTKATVTLCLPPNAAHVRTARLVAAAMARRSGVDEALLDEVRLAVGEACARAVRLHERYGVTDPITVEFGDVDRFMVAVIDRATPAPSDRRESPPTGPARTPGPGASSDSLRQAGLDGVRRGSVVMPAGQAPPGFDETFFTAGSLSSDAAPWADPSGDALGLALLDAVVQDLAVLPAPAGVGSRVTMSWPLGQ